ncbi:DUF2357 domain-containing protein [Paenibacillus sp.]|uniref:DUF2357 domain-containing protein n=1 Tax=Paenibacillus sp. TaxID=58172 RepID=UPI00281133DD|nr:DUF2357 domain-containing protein [Paenibacillus sp.]
MDSLPSGSRDQPKHLVKIETNLFDFYITGKPVHPTVEAFQLHRTVSGVWEPCHFQVKKGLPDLDIEQLEVYSVETGGMVDGFLEKVPPLFYETQHYQIIIESKCDREIIFHHENSYIRQAVKKHGKNVAAGMISFQNEVGFTDFQIRVDGSPALTVEIEVFPTKLDYRKDYQLLLEDVNRQIYNLTFDFLRKTYHLTALKETASQSLTEFFTLISHVFGQLVKAYDLIQTAPYHNLTKDVHVKNSAQAKRPGRNNITFLQRNTHLLAESPANGFIHSGGKMYLPTKLLETKRVVNYDTNENRFLKWVLERIQGKLQSIESEIKRREKNKDLTALKPLSSMRSQIRQLLQADYLRDVGSIRNVTISLVLQMAPGYKDVYRLYLILMKGLSIQGELYQISMKDLAQLYEYWCFLKLNDLLGKKYRLVSQDVVRVNRGGLFVTLDKTRKATMQYVNPANGERFTLFYNRMPEDQQFPTLAQVPDNVLTLWKKDTDHEPQIYKYVFDAKYRIDPAYESSPYQKKYGRAGPVEDDINTMHRYRDAIVQQSKGSAEFERTMFGAYVLFPYGNEEEYKEHRFYKSIKLVNVGGLPFLPNSTGLVEAFLDELILDSPEKAYERSTRPRGTATYYENKYAGKNVLVGSMKTGQLEVALSERFYHIPLSNLKDHKILTQLEYVALSQSRKQFDEDAGIRWFGKITDWKIVKRKEILERPADPARAEELYVYFKVEHWERRSTAIALGGQSIYRCLLTSKYMFDRAEDVAELRLESEEQLKEWREKRRLGKVKVMLDNDYADLAKQVLGIDISHSLTSDS